MKTISPRAFSPLLVMAVLALLGACGGGGSSTTTTPVTPVTPVPVAAAINLSGTSTSVASDNSTSTVITATVVDAANAAVSGVTINFAADTGFLSLGTAVSDAGGKATVTFSSGSSDPTSRTSTITATASGKSSQIPIRISGSTIDVVSTAASLVVGGTPASLTVTVKNASGAVLPNQAVTVTAGGAGALTLAPASGVTDSSGKFTSTVTGTAGGTVTVTATAVGETRTFGFTVSGPSVAFQITSLSANPTANAANIGTPVTVSVQAPAPTTSVTFVSTLGGWDGTANATITKGVANGTVSATLVSTLSGVANIQVYDSARQAALTDSRVLSYSASPANAFKVTIQSSPSVVAPSSGGNTGLSTLIATVTDSGGNPVGGASVAFRIINPTGGGETVSPAVVLTASVAGNGIGLGQATTTFSAGSLPSGASGVSIKATVVGTALATGTAPSGSDAAIVIGGTAGSVTIGRSTTVAEDGNGTLYVLPMSVLVADSNGNPVANTVVSLSAWPIAFNVGGTTCAGSPPVQPGAAGTFYINEDANENLVLDNGEDGVRRLYSTGVLSASGPIDRILTPPNSAAGTLPGTVTTAANGVATFNLTYTKSNAQWIIDRIRARTFVQGTETLGEIRLPLPYLVSDGAACLLPSSPYQ